MDYLGHFFEVLDLHHDPNKTHAVFRNVRFPNLFLTEDDLAYMDLADDILVETAEVCLPNSVYLNQEAYDQLKKMSAHWDSGAVTMRTFYNRLIKIHGFGNTVYNKMCDRLVVTEMLCDAKDRHSFMVFSEMDAIGLGYVCGNDKKFKHSYTSKKTVHMMTKLMKEIVEESKVNKFWPVDHPELDLRTVRRGLVIYRIFMKYYFAYRD